jgi:hypothetical protein
MLKGSTMAPLKTDLGERLLNNVASQSIRQLFSASEQVDVAIGCYPSSKLLQGSIDSFKMTGKNLVIKKQFQVYEMSFATDAVAIDAGALMGGKLKLKQPTQAVAQVVLTEAGLNEAFTADLVTQHLRNVDHPDLLNLSGGEPVSFSDISLHLLPNNQIQLLAKAHLPNGEVPISLTANLEIARRRRLVFSNPQFIEAEVPEALQAISKVLTMVFAGILNEMVDLDRFNLDGVTLRLNRLETQGSHLVFSGYAEVSRFPGS